MCLGKGGGISLGILLLFLSFSFSTCKYMYTKVKCEDVIIVPTMYMYMGCGASIEINANRWSPWLARLVSYCLRYNERHTCTICRSENVWVLLLTLRLFRRGVKGPARNTGFAYTLMSNFGRDFWGTNTQLLELSYDDFFRTVLEIFILQRLKQLKEWPCCSSRVILW